MAEAAFAFVDGVRAGVRGPASIVDAFRLEYAPREVLDRAALALDIRFGRETAHAAAVVAGRHKSVGWRIALGPAGAAPIQADIHLRGMPRSFARSLVQGYAIEPLVSIVAAEHGQALVPSAGVAGPTGVTLILGRSRAGKSTLMARLMAAGHEVLGDDQLFLDASGACVAFPRRLRFYPDLETTAPAAYARMPAAIRRRLRLMGLLSTVTRGHIRPSLAVDRTAIGGHWVPGPLPIERVVLLQRGDHAGELRSAPASPEQAVAWATRLLAEQRARLALSSEAGWRARLDRASEAEVAILSDTFAGPAIVSISVPHDWPAAAAVTAVARRLGLDV